MSLPITKQEAYSVAKWIKSNFSSSISPLIESTPFSIDLVCGIACQETAYFFIHFFDSLTVEEILARCVLDASGDAPHTSRSVFPKNTNEFKKRFGALFTEILIEEANKTRTLRGFNPCNWVYKGYGIFQYDLQYVIEDESFFRMKKWYNFSDCLDRLLKELTNNYKIHNDIWKSLKAYNGAGEVAEHYADNVMQFASYCSEI